MHNNNKKLEKERKSKNADSKDQYYILAIGHFAFGVNKKIGLGASGVKK